MPKKIVFVDVDGTLVNDDGLVPDSARTAIIEARNNGHQVYLCTGRSKPELYESILSIGFDGVIGAGGGYVEVDDKIIYHQKVANEDVVHMVDFFNKKKLDFYLESNGGLFASENLESHLNKLIYGDVENDPIAREKQKNNPHPFMGSLTFGETNLYRTDVNKACFLENKEVPFEEIKNEFSGKFEVMHCTVPIFGDDSGELMVPNIHKATAIEILLEHIAKDKQDTIGIGDGMNDAEMLTFCKTGIAMGNAKKNLKLLADEVTSSVDEDGLFASFQKHGLI
ncbi:Cof-type HAD-IIB family hydrolase [Listeria ivanovii]|uniref:Hydrolase n=1 Tax=Listeria ivanovii (strain ATCC BAA-678 / PAM 55) TaxID=881621 RepID=G2ZEY3_LISIP|nr:Cof-type HAD-IIB family hydrolase [Listeria ivanovii]AHI56795.1 COF family hydrolase [Listeria ivanovii WSLC3009]AIS66212.1 hydrolase [Listeria ivanovii subsp. ivanovii]MBC1760451.1 Cof-type HAD-IIB family hydrolase [Listeria ivanovii]MBK3913768.1 Cof-type HAD-IIB family hydrolase [Listeria ivanovii subsp. ivanovii]MBK3921394.1 Cof-type HAD-IIB family hydrolase [Listeria ivanovii subsp. ivanovii]